MALKIVHVNLKTEYSWQDVSELADWRAVKNRNKNWHEIKQTSIVGEPVTIEVEVAERNWGGIKDSFKDWEEIKNHFADWMDLKYW